MYIIGRWYFVDYNFKLDQFEGPLDLLLHMIKEKKMDILEINVAQIASQYVELIHNMKTLNLEVAAEYLEMAAYLVEIKSKALIPREVVNVDGNYEMDERERLIKRLLEYKKFKEISAVLDKMADERLSYFSKESSSLKEFETILPESEIPQDLDMNALVMAFEKMFKRLADRRPIETKMVKSEISIEERKIEMENIINSKTGKFSVMEFFTDRFDKYFFVATIVALLDFAKHRYVLVSQDSEFGEIMVERR